MKKDHNISADGLRKAFTKGGFVILQYRRSVTRSHTWRNYLPVPYWDAEGAAGAIGAWLERAEMKLPPMPKLVVVWRNLTARYL